MSQLPAKTYPKFYEAFEKAVTERQEEIKRMDENQDIYAAVQEAAEAQAKLLSRFKDVSLKLYATGVTLHIDAADTEITPTEVRALNDAIGRELLSRRLHTDGEPSVYSYNHFEYRWFIKRKNSRTSSVCVELFLGHTPTNLTWVDAKKELHTYTSTSYILTWRDKPRTSQEHLMPGQIPTI